MTLETLVVNLFAGPGTGKSTNASAVFADLKMKGISAEIVHEFAKDLTWEDRGMALRYQPYIFGKQSYHIHRLLGQVDVIVTDSPIILSTHIYSRSTWGNSQQALKDLGMATFREWNTLNFFIRRNVIKHGFVQSGRVHDLAESEALDEQIRKLLINERISFDVVSMFEPEHIVKRILDKLH